MDNISVLKIYEEYDFFEVEIRAENEYIKVTQTCYIGIDEIENNIKIINDYLEASNSKCYIEFGCIEGNSSPAFSMTFLPLDSHGHIKIEMDMEIVDNTERIHRAKFYVNTELGRLYCFKDKLQNIEFGEEINLNLLV